MTLNPKQFFARCPYCGHENREGISPATAEQLARAGTARVEALSYCDEEDGGCGEVFALRTKISLAFAVEVFALAGRQTVADKDAKPEDRRRFDVHTKHADDPEANRRDSGIPADRLSSFLSGAMLALALEMQDADSLKFVSSFGLVSFSVICEEPEEPDTPDAARFDSYSAARLVASETARLTGSTQEIYFHVGAFYVFPANPLPIPPPPADAEFVLTVEPAVTFKLETRQTQEADPAKGLPPLYVADVLCDDERANPRFQEHGESIIYTTGPNFSPEAACLEAAEWIRSEFPTAEGRNNVFIDSPFPLEEDEDIPFDESERPADFSLLVRGRTILTDSHK